MDTLRQNVEATMKRYRVSKEDRVRYQLHKQKISISKLLKTRNEDGSDKSDREKEIYCSEKNQDSRVSECARYTRYMTDMPREAYVQLCRRLRISTKPSLQELLEIKLWKKQLEKESIGFKKRESKESIRQGKKDNTKPSKRIIEQREQTVLLAVEKAAELFEADGERLYIEQEHINEIYERLFRKYAEEVSCDILEVWYKYPKLFEKQFLPELDFCDMYHELSEDGKRIFHEVILLNFEESDYTYEDDRIKMYSDIRQINVSEEDNVDVMIEEIYNRWAAGYEIDDLKCFEELTRKLIECTEEECQSLIDYHRIRVLGEKLKVEGKSDSFLDYLEFTLIMLANVPILQKVQSHNQE